MQQTRNSRSSGASQRRISQHTLVPEVRGRSRGFTAAAIRRARRAPASARSNRRASRRPTLPRSAATPPMTLLVTERVTSRAMTWPVDILPRLTLVPKIVPTIEPICPRIPPPPRAAILPIRRRRRSGHALLQHLIGGFGIDRGVVFALDRALVHDRLALLRRDRPDPRRRRPDHDALDHGRRAAAFEERHQRFALAEFHDDAGGIELRVGPEGLRRRRHRLLVARREGAQRVLHAVAQLGEHLVRHVDRVLRDEIDADALGADQADHLLDLVHQRLRRVVEQQMRLVEEEHQFRLRQVAGFRQLFKQLRQHPQQEGGVEPAGSASACRRPGY